MLYLIKDPSCSDLRYFFASPTACVASTSWAYSIPKAVDEYVFALKRNNSRHHSVLSWINSGCPGRHSGYSLVAVFESDDLTQDFEAGITTFREDHPEYFL